MNSAINVDAKELLAIPGTENVFNDAFFESLDFVTNALDNVKARQYIDDRCVFYGKPLLESGTQGTKCNSQVIIPFKTESYNDQKDGDDGDAIPMCTLRNFPSQIEHCIEWARALFEDDLAKPFNDLKKFAEEKEGYLAEMTKAMADAISASGAIGSGQALIDLIEQSNKIVAADDAKKFELIVELAYNQLHYLFRDRILNLTHDFPEDKLTKEGKKFWKAPKRFPKVMAFDKTNPNHINFIISYSNILRVCFGLMPETTGDPSTHVPADSK